MQTTARPLHVVLALIALYLIWGSTYLGIRFALEGGFAPLTMAGIRFLIAGGLMFAVLRFRGVAAPTRAQWRNAAVMGALLLGLGNGLVSIAQQWVSSGMAAVAVASAPLWMGLFATLRGERPGPLEWVGLAIGFIGVLWLNAGSSLTASKLGLVLLLIAPLAWSFGSIWSRGRDLPSPFMTAASQMLCGGALMFAAGLLLGEHVELTPTAKGVWALAYLVVFGSIIGFSAYIWLLRHVRPALAGSYAYVNPAIAVLLGMSLAGERFSPTDLVAMGVIVTGVLGITVGKAWRPRVRTRP
ncbi:MAG: drug/metabolite exporter YedA [Pseudoxanthomonas suwonensis]|nr:drug/metabolite exporter YedA [Pseudoxanthomonas suwonensis]